MRKNKIFSVLLSALFLVGCSQSNVIRYQASEKIHVTIKNGWGAEYLPERSQWDPESGKGTLVFSQEIKRIPKKAFSKRKALTQIEIPSTVEIIRDNAFEFCENLSEITVSGNDGESCLFLWIRVN